MDTPSSKPNRQPTLPSARELQVLYPRLAEREKLAQEATRVFLRITFGNQKPDHNTLIQVFLNYCTTIQKQIPVYAEQAKLAFEYIERHAEHVDVNDNTSHLRELYPFLGPLITTIRSR